MGRKYTQVPHWELLWPACEAAYRHLEQLLQVPLLNPAVILKRHSSEDDAVFWQQRVQAVSDYLSDATVPELAMAWQLDTPYSYGVTQHAFQLHSHRLQKAYLALLAAEGNLIENSVPERNQNEDPSGPISFNDTAFTHIIFCEGRNTLNRPEWAFLPLSVNKGQALVVDFEAALPRNGIIKCGKELTLCPYGDRYWWAGASFEWKFDTDGPTDVFREQTLQRIQQYTSIPFRILESLSGFRVSAQDRTAVAGWHPKKKQFGILNALGTKGVLQAPHAAKALVNTLLAGKFIHNPFALERFRSS